MDSYKVNAQKQSLEVDTRFIDNYSFCPFCKKDFKVYRNEVQNAYTASAFIPMGTEKLVLYCLCKSCVNKLGNKFESNWVTIENNIYEKLPDLKVAEYTLEHIENANKKLNDMTLPGMSFVPGITYKDKGAAETEYLKYFESIDVNLGFQYYSSELLADMIDICLEFVEDKADVVYICGMFLENSIASDFFYRVNGKLKKKSAVNNSIDLQNQVNTILKEDIKKMSLVSLKFNNEMPCAFTIEYDVKTKEVKSKLKYIDMFNDKEIKELNIEDLSSSWFKELLTKNN